jgi:hypothetical protein
MTDRRLFLAALVALALTLSGCSASPEGTRVEQTLSTFAVDFARQILAAFLL